MVRIGSRTRPELGKPTGLVAAVHAKVFVAEHSSRLVAFSLLSRTGDAEAEFRVALRDDVIGQGLAGTITSMTLAKGFEELNPSRIHLIVRKNNTRAIRLYQRLGFTERGESWKDVEGKQVRFLEMDLLK